MTEASMADVHVYHVRHQRGVKISLIGRHVRHS